MDIAVGSRGSRRAPPVSRSPPVVGGKLTLVIALFGSFLKNLNAIHPPATERARFSNLILATKQPSAPQAAATLFQGELADSCSEPHEILHASIMHRIYHNTLLPVPSCHAITLVHTMGDSTYTNVLALTFPEAPVSRNPAQMPAGLQAADPSSPATSHRPCGTQSDALVIGKSLLPWAASPAELATCDTMLHLAALGKRSENLRTPVSTQC